MNVDQGSAAILTWRRTKSCSAGECVEMAAQGGQILLRNSSKPQTVVRYTPGEWRAFVEGLRAGEFDDLG